MTCISGHISLLFNVSGQKETSHHSQSGFSLLSDLSFSTVLLLLASSGYANFCKSNLVKLHMCGHGAQQGSVPGLLSPGFCDRLGCRPIACPHTPERWLPLLNEADRQRDDGRRNTTETDGFEHVMTVTRLPRELGAESIRPSAVFSICRGSECCRG